MSNTYTQIFGGTTIYPSDVSYLALSLTADTALDWSPLAAAIDAALGSGVFFDPPQLWLCFNVLGRVLGTVNETSVAAMAARVEGAAASGALVFTLAGHAGAVTGLALHPHAPTAEEVLGAPCMATSLVTVPEQASATVAAAMPSYRSPGLVTIWAHSAASGKRRANSDWTGPAGSTTTFTAGNACLTFRAASISTGATLATSLRRLPGRTISSGSSAPIL
jgi:hypothetical protein